MDAPPLGVPLGGDALPAVRLLAVRPEPRVDLRHHGHVPVPKLPRDELERGATPGHPHRPVVPSVVRGAAREAERPEPLPVGVARGGAGG